MGKRLASHGYDTDKWEDLLDAYDAFFAPLRNRPIVLLELGVLRGGSLRLWRDHFPQGTIVGIDVDLVVPDDPRGRIRTFKGRQDDYALLDRVRWEIAPDGFDIVIDDASHIGDITRRSFWHLFRHHVKPAGMYSIEDWGTGYWDSWPDGRPYRRDHATPLLDDDWDAGDQGRSAKGEFGSHTAGMVGVVKELVDEVAIADITRRGPTGDPSRYSIIRSLTVLPGMVIAVKR